MAKACKIDCDDERDTSGIVERVLIFCPGCRFGHAFNTKVKARKDGSTPPCWAWNGDVDSPTFDPSMLVRYPWGEVRPDGTREERVCHSFVRGGKIEFLHDCTHDLKNQTVELEEIT